MSMITGARCDPTKAGVVLVHGIALTRGSDSMEVGGVSWCLSWQVGPGLPEAPLGGGRCSSLAWSCLAEGQGRVPRTHSTGSSQGAFWPPWT